MKTSPKFEAGAPKALVDPRIAPAANPALYFRYDVTADGKRFLVDTIPAATDSSTPAPITVVLNWQAGLKK